MKSFPTSPPIARSSCHSSGCHSGLTEEAYQRMYEPPCFGTKACQDDLRLSQPTRTRYWTGGQLHWWRHIQYRLPVPNRVLRRQNGSLRQRTLYLMSYEPKRLDEIRTLLAQSIADYVWLTQSARRAPATLPLAALEHDRVLEAEPVLDQRHSPLRVPPAEMCGTTRSQTAACAHAR